MMLFKKTKQTLAALLCLCMVAAILPAGVPAAKAATAATYTFCPLSGVKDGTVVNTIAQSTTGNWKFHSSSLDASATKYYKTYGLQTANIGEGQWVAYELQNATKGYYSTKFTYLYSNSGTDAELYLIPAAATVDVSACNDSTYLGLVEFSRWDGTTGGEADDVAYLNNVFIPNDGNYILVLKSTGKMHYGSYQYLWAKGFELSPLADGVYAELASDTIEEGSSCALDVDVAVNGEAVTGFDVSFSDPTVASYADGKVKGLKVGTTDITVSYGDYSKVLSLTVKEIYRDTVITIKGLGLSDGNTYIKDIPVENLNGDWEHHSSRTFYDKADGTAQDAWALAWTGESIYFYNTAKKTDRYVAFKLLDVYAGDYKVSVDLLPYTGGGILEFYLVPDCETVDLDTMCTPKTWIGNVDFWANNGLSADIEVTDYLKDVTIKEAGDYVLIAKGTGRTTGTSAYGAYMTEFKMEWQGAPTEAAEGNAAFSDTYAYVRRRLESGIKNYDVTLIGGIKVDDLADYKNVGFDIDSDYYDATLTASNIYETLTLSDGTVNASDFGVDYFFVQTFTVSVENDRQGYDFMTFNAVATTANDDIIEGIKHTVQIAK